MVRWAGLVWLVALLAGACTRQLVDFDTSAGVFSEGRMRVTTADQVQVVSVDAILWHAQKTSLRLRHPFSGQILWEARADGDSLWLRQASELSGLSSVPSVLNGWELRVLLSGMPPPQAQYKGNAVFWQSGQAGVSYRGQLDSAGWLSTWQRWQGSEPVLLVEYLAYNTSASLRGKPQRLLIKVPDSQLEALLVFARYKPAPKIPSPFLP